MKTTVAMRMKKRVSQSRWLGVNDVRAGTRAAALVLYVLLGNSAAIAQLEPTLPNFTGVWTRYPGFRESHPDPKLVPPAPGQPPLKPAIGARYAARKAAERESDERGEPLATRGTECVPYGMPVMMSAVYPIEILQTPGQVTILAEALREVRRIYTSKTQPPPDEVAPGYYGHSVGRWDGATLVVDTVGILEKVLGYMDTPHSSQLRITERLHLVAPDVLYDDVTVSDPVTFTAP